MNHDINDLQLILEDDKVQWTENIDTSCGIVHRGIVLMATDDHCIVAVESFKSVWPIVWAPMSALKKIKEDA